MGQQYTLLFVFIVNLNSDEKCFIYIYASYIVIVRSVIFGLFIYDFYENVSEIMLLRSAARRLCRSCGQLGAPQVQIDALLPVMRSAWSPTG